MQYPEFSDIPFHSSAPWNDQRPRVLVVACSDGRLQENVDEFLSRSLGIERYDRLYAPGGPGALASSGIEYLRSDLFHRECLFLVTAHQIEEVILLFHGPSSDGPDSAVCADYRRIFPTASAHEILRHQEEDVRQILARGFGVNNGIRVRVFRCEVGPQSAIQFVSMDGSAFSPA